MDNLGVFILTAFLIESTPGPNMAFLALISATEGRRYGFATTLGVALGLLIIGLLAAAGVAAVISQSPIMFQILRWGGIVYLLYLAWEGWREAGENSPSTAHGAKSSATYFRHGLIVNLLNPKAAFFYIAILPTFVSTTDTSFTQTASLTLLYVGIATIMHILIVTFASLFNPFLADPKRNKMTRQILSLALAVVAIWFGYSTRGGVS
ncbi:LysE family translocator [Litorimonas sp. RW-G-Af-16]|uniref:LysE family translocator n=1 Tax=Litorimonas sp. RW-G-Af-16 TaxID=3241168 RepID=UPI00390CCA4C